MTVRKDVSLGIIGEKVPLGAHVAYFWENEREFERAVGFLSTGIRARDHCVIFGHDEANREVCGVLERLGFDPATLQAETRLTLIGGSSERATLQRDIVGAFQRAIDGGAACIRLLGNIGWNNPGWPGEKELLAFEAEVTGAAKMFPCVVVCMYDVSQLTGSAIVHGAFETHPLTIYGNVLRENPYYTAPASTIAGLESGAEFPNP